jgi:hypothetical protein
LIGLNRFMRASGRPLINLPKPGAGTRFIEKVAPAKSAMGLEGAEKGIGNSGQSPLRLILLQKSFWDGERKFLEPLMRFARGDVRDRSPTSVAALKSDTAAEKSKDTFARFLGSFNFRLLQHNRGVSGNVSLGQSITVFGPGSDIGRSTILRLPRTISRSPTDRNVLVSSHCAVTCKGASSSRLSAARPRADLAEGCASSPR